MDEIGRDVMEGASPAARCRSCCAGGCRTAAASTSSPARSGSAAAAAAGEPARRHAAEVRELLRRALDAERDALARDDGDDARFREMQLDALPSDTGGAVRELAEYDWRSSDAREAYEEIRDLLGREMLDQRFQGMKQAMENATPQDVERIREMLDDLNSLLANHAQGQDTAQQFGEFMQRHGEFFPEGPRAPRSSSTSGSARAAAQRMLNSMTEAQRRSSWSCPSRRSATRGSPRRWPSSTPSCRACAPARTGTAGAASAGRTRWAWARPPAPWRSWASSTRWPSSSPRATRGRRLEDIDLESLERHLGDQARVDARALADLQRELERQGLFERAADGSLQLSPKALRRLGESALREVVDRIGGRARRARDAPLRRVGRGHRSDPAVGVRRHRGLERPRTLLNAQLRRAGGDDRRLDVTDVEIVETEQRTRAAVALCVDTSWSMVQDGRWVPMKRTALALHQLISTRFRGDDLKLIGFGRHARDLQLGSWWAWRAPGSRAPTCTTRCCWPATTCAGTPTPSRCCSSSPTGSRRRTWSPTATPPSTTRPVRDAAGHGGRGRPARRPAGVVHVLRARDDPRLARFMDGVARRCGGRVVAPTLDGLGAEVVADYLRTRR
jgi:uncharacterized protein with von Willebrand factor type A (vWA) domain